MKPNEIFDLFFGTNHNNSGLLNSEWLACLYHKNTYSCKIHIFCDLDQRVFTVAHICKAFAQTLELVYFISKIHKNLTYDNLHSDHANYFRCRIGVSAVQPYLDHGIFDKNS